jgi:hypothetical protein
MGDNGYEQVKQNFPFIRHVKDYMLAGLALEHPGEGPSRLNELA